MGISVTAENVHDAMDKMGISCQNYSITIMFRKRTDYYSDQFRDPGRTGCIVQSHYDNSLPLEFESSAKAIAHIQGILTKHDEAVRKYAADERKQIAKMKRDQVIAAKIAKLKAAQR